MSDKRSIVTNTSSTHQCLERNYNVSALPYPSSTVYLLIGHIVTKEYDHRLFHVLAHRLQRATYNHICPNVAQRGLIEHLQGTNDFLLSHGWKHYIIFFPTEAEFVLNTFRPTDYELTLKRKISSPKFWKFNSELTVYKISVAEHESRSQIHHLHVRVLRLQWIIRLQFSLLKVSI